MDAAVTLDRLVKQFGQVRAVDELSARFPPGQITGLLGPNGAGKTTTIRMMMDIFRPDSGRIEILGSAEPGDVKDRIGYLPEDRGLYPKMRIGAMLEYFAGIKGLRSSDATAGARWWLDRLGLGGRIGERVESLSRGMQQKLQLIVALLHEPDLLILDEPFTGLDPVNLQQVDVLLHELRDAGRTILLSTHMMEHAERLCDRFVLINRGRSVLEGTLAEIRGQAPVEAVRLELAAPAEWLAELPIVAAVRPAAPAPAVEVILTPGAHPQGLLAVLVERGCEVVHFSQKRPTLHDIFVREVAEEAQHA